MLDTQADPARGKDRIHPQAVARAVSDLAKPDAVFTLDTGLNTLWSGNWIRATRAVAAYKRHKADRIVAEANQGGAMVETTLRAVDRSIPVRLVHASRGKITRAEPVSALYEQHRCHHVGCFPELEDELCSFEPGSTDSPDRLDALVWGLTDLMLGGFQEMTSFHASVAGPGRSAWIAEAGLPLSAADGAYADASIPPGGWAVGVRG